MSEESVEWTTNMTFPIGDGFEVNDVSTYIQEFFEVSIEFSVLHNDLCNKFSLTDDDASLAIERAISGVVRALTTNIKNEPSITEDPIANFMFNIVWDSMPSKGILKRRKIASGKWLNWDNQRRAMYA